MLSLLICRRASRTHWPSESSIGVPTLFWEPDNSLRSCVIYRGFERLDYQGSEPFVVDRKVFGSVRSGLDITQLGLTSAFRWIGICEGDERKWTGHVRGIDP